MGLKPPETQRAPAVIDLCIEELVLHGFPSSDRFRIGDAVERELLRLIDAQGLPPALLRKQLSAERLDAGTFKVAHGAKPQTVGTQLARSLHQRLSRPEKPPTSSSRAKEGEKGR
jgi:hypothetical protein